MLELSFKNWHNQHILVHSAGYNVGVLHLLFLVVVDPPGGHKQEFFSEQLNT